MRLLAPLIFLSACVALQSHDTSSFYVLVTSDLGDVEAISGLAAARGGENGEAELWAVSDGEVAPSRIFGLDASTTEVRVRSEHTLTLDGRSVSYDLEGIDVDPNGGWWLAAEGDASNASIPNLLVHVSTAGEVTEEIPLPDSVTAWQEKNGFEGVACDDDGARVFVAFQRGWADDPEGQTRIGLYTPATGEWAFYHYPLSQGSGDIGLSEITWAGEDQLVLLERDDQVGDESEIKQLTVVSLADIEPAPAGSTPPVLEPRLLRDLVASDDWRLEKAEGLAFLGDDAVVVSDNDGEDVPTLALIIDELGNKLE